MKKKHHQQWTLVKPNGERTVFGNRPLVYYLRRLFGAWFALLLGMLLASTCHAASNYPGGIGVQRKDIGRRHLTWQIQNQASTSAANGLFTLSLTTSGPAQLGQTPVSSVFYTITSSKTLRIESVYFALTSSGATVALSSGTFSIYAAFNGGACSTASPLQRSYTVSVAATAGTVAATSVSYPDGVEYYDTLNGTGTTLCWALSVPGFVPAANNPQATIDIEGFEY